MNRLQHLLSAQNAYNIQSPFLYDLYCHVVDARISRSDLRKLGLQRRDRYGQLRFKLMDYYGAMEVDNGRSVAADIATKGNPNIGTNLTSLMCREDGSLIRMMRKPHRNSETEAQWEQLVGMTDTRMVVDLYDVGLIFTSTKLARQRFIMR